MQKNSCPQSGWFSAKGVALAGFAALVLVGGIFWTVHRAHAESGTKTIADVAPSVAVAKVTRRDLARQVTIAAEFRPYQEVELHAKVSGYLQEINVDFGDKVKAGDLLATLEVPELKDELASAQAAERKAEADFTNASLIYSRLQSVNQQHANLVAQQELDTAQANDLTATAAIAAAKAEASKYETMLAYTKITAPFDGVITKRSADPGALIQSGISSDTQPLLRVSDNYHLRLDFLVTVDYVKDIHVGDSVAVRVDSLGGKILTGKISRFTSSVDDKTRTMTTEIEVPNPDLQLVPGMYASVVLELDRHPGALAIPTEAVSGGSTPVVFVVNDRDEVEKRPVKLGLETSDKYEVLSGLSEGERVVIGNHTEFSEGEKVEPKPVQLSMTNEN
jgi:RND family efflux transporter MFP subunit